MPLPSPHPGLVIHYAYLWHAEHNQGQEEGIKDRPCVIVLTAEGAAGETVVTVLPITHTPPSDPGAAVEIPLPTKQRLGLDPERSWVICSEINRFVWPGPDLRAIPGRPGEIAYGTLPPRLFQQIKQCLLSLADARRLRAVARSQ
jgi:mRNA-degrading endonuclease toxin of MazEF toxin-antitoxin module